MSSVRFIDNMRILASYENSAFNSATIFQQKMTKPKEIRASESNVPDWSDNDGYYLMNEFLQQQKNPCINGQGMLLAAASVTDRAGFPQVMWLHSRQQSVCRQ
jgi:hypothetical protein